MAHPTIDLIQSPETGCPQPVYNCVKYCFKANDFQTQVGTKAEFTIESTQNDSWLPGIPFTISGQVYETGTVNSYNKLDTAGPLSKEQFILNMMDALTANSHIYGLYDIVQTSSTLITATAREVGIIEDFDFDLSNLPSINQTDTQGLEDTYRENYRLVVEIWALTWDAIAVDFIPQKISTEAYTPDPESEICINIGQKVSSLVESRFVYDQNQLVASYIDDNIYKPIFIRYGEIYSDAIGECEVLPRDFATSETITVINSAFQRGEDIDKIANICNHEWMTNAPQFTLVSECSEFVLWINLDNILPAPPTVVTVGTRFIITYTDGTTSSHITAIFHSAPSYIQLKAIPCGSTVINALATPGKVVDYYQVQIEQDDGGINLFGSQFFKRTRCCGSDVEFYFLNEYGGRDAILFTQVDTIQLEQEKAVFESFLDCEDPNALFGGKSTVDQTANDVFEVTSKFVNDYQTGRWIREFLTSPQKAVRTTIQGESEILSNVIVLTGSVQYFKKDESIFIRLQYILNENINLQKN